MSNIIKFSHFYHKLHLAMGDEPNGKVCWLMEVINVNLEDLSNAFLDFDTDGGKYKLPKKGKYLLLLFMGQSGIFPTLRRWTPSKEKYYREMRTFNFTIECPNKS